MPRLAASIQVLLALASAWELHFTASPAPPSATMRMTNKWGDRFVCAARITMHHAGEDELRHTARTFSSATNADSSAWKLLDAKLYARSYDSDCLRLDNGWWLYLLCFQRHVYQFHVEADSAPSGDGGSGSGGGVKTEVFKIGVFAESFEANLTARSPPRHEYTDGDRCEGTDMHHSATVLFRCRPGAVPVLASVSEPTPCHYVLTVFADELCAAPAAPPAPDDIVTCYPAPAALLLGRYPPRWVVGQTWRGSYTCQGVHHLSLRVYAVTESHVFGVVAFRHSGVAGVYMVEGSLSVQSGSAFALRPGSWLAHPADFIPVTLQGDWAESGDLVGVITECNLGPFWLLLDDQNVQGGDDPSKAFLHAVDRIFSEFNWQAPQHDVLISLLLAGPAESLQDTRREDNLDDSGSRLLTSADGEEATSKSTKYGDAGPQVTGGSSSRARSSHDNEPPNTVRCLVYDKV